MCRYSFPGYRTSFVCVPCRHVAQYDANAEPRCPSCRADMNNIGHDFHAPRKRNDAGWQAVALNLSAGRRFDSCGCNGPGYRPATPAQARQDSFVRAWKPRGAK